MIFLHNSLNSKKFSSDKKLNLLRKNIITVGQFINLIEPSDGYILIGPAIVDKSKVKEFIAEWKEHQLDISSTINDNTGRIEDEEIVDSFDIIAEAYPETASIIDEYKQQIKLSTCTKCTRNHYITRLVISIKRIQESEDTRDLGKAADIINRMLEKYNVFLKNSKGVKYLDYDTEWIRPEELVGIGYDLMEKLEQCLECSIKHIGRAKILFDEYCLGYPEHLEISMDELAKGNKDIEQLYLKWMDICSELDMGSVELVGDIEKLNLDYGMEILELANKIREQRILFQEDRKNIPDFDGLRLQIKKFELKIKKDSQLE